VRYGGFGALLLGVVRLAGKQSKRKANQD
jgi:hypothetical protein